MALGRAADVKTSIAKSGYPYVRLVRGKYWYFHCRDALIPLPEYGTDKFAERYQELTRLYGLDETDDRLVYFIGWRNGPVKIGIADDVPARFAILQVACPYELIIYAVCEGGRDTELAYHRRFAAARMRGEWFKRTKEIDAEIDRLASEPVPLNCAECSGVGIVENGRGIPRTCAECSGKGKVLAIPHFVARDSVRKTLACGPLGSVEK